MPEITHPPGYLNVVGQSTTGFEVKISDGEKFLRLNYDLEHSATTQQIIDRVLLTWPSVDIQEKGMPVGSVEGWQEFELPAVIEE